jgi:hypothetical protein
MDFEASEEGAGIFEILLWGCASDDPNDATGNENGAVPWAANSTVQGPIHAIDGQQIWDFLHIIRTSNIIVGRGLLKKMAQWSVAKRKAC